LAPVTVNWTRTPGVGLANSSPTVAVTQCCSPAAFVAAAGASVTVAARPGRYVFAAAPVGSVGANVLSSFASATALIASAPVTVPV
jgi:hypothetical protein